MPKESIQMLSDWSQPVTRSYFDRCLNSSYLSFKLRSIFILFMQPSCFSLATLSAGMKRRSCVLYALMLELRTAPLDFQASASWTTFSGLPSFECSELNRLMCGEPTLSYSLVPMPRASYFSLRCLIRSLPAPTWAFSLFAAW